MNNIIQKTSLVKFYLPRNIVQIMVNSGYKQSYQLLLPKLKLYNFMRNYKKDSFIAKHDRLDYVPFDRSYSINALMKQSDKLRLIAVSEVYYWFEFVINIEIR